MIRPLPVVLPVLLLVSALAAPPAWRARAQSLDAPGDYRFTPSATTGEASVAYGSHNLRSAAIQMRTGLLGDTGLRGFAALQTATADGLRTAPGAARTRLSMNQGEIGLQKSFADGASVSIAAGWTQLRARGLQPFTPP